jgi:1,4-dihydroxy-2-naphthoate octaprenyltransferase
VLFGKHTDKLPADRDKGVRTLPVILGEQRSRKVVVSLLMAQYLLSIGLVLNGSFHWSLLLVLLNFPNLLRTIKVFQQPKPMARPEAYPAEIWPLWFSAHTFRHTRKFTSLFLVGVLIDTLIH